MGDSEGAPARLVDGLEQVLRYGALLLRAGDAAFRVRAEMGGVASALGIEALAVQVALGTLTASARRGAAAATLVREVGHPG
ncbi:MAG: threonine/serine exporter family protein [Deltaproteobacteria bacterium]|nr:threonine/serine exporter family protein [Deltaproteobacteria bacterium]